ncbi:MAG: 50S ribosomal protein L6 [Flavobacteriales bacterium]|nr:50S ribosomal protein L6 [Flavobacteriales bacterium]
MSRIGNAPVAIPSGVTVAVEGNVIKVKGPKGELEQAFDAAIEVKIEEGVVVFSRKSNLPDHRAKHGLYRSLCAGMVEGVTKGYKKELELVGVGFRAQSSGQQLTLALGYSHPIIIQIPTEVKLTAESKKGSNPKVTLESHDKQLLGTVAAKIRSLRKPEPYKGKGVRFTDEYIRRKAGKSAAK